MRHVFNEREKAMIRKRYEKEGSVKLAIELGVPQQTVRRWAHSVGLKTLAKNGWKGEKYHA